MNRLRAFQGTLGAVAVVLLLVPGSLSGVEVDTGYEKVVVDGNYVRVEGVAGVTEVSGDWRSGGSVHISDTDSVLVELGATEAADHIHLAMQGDILFDFGSSKIQSDAAQRLAKVAHVIRQRAAGEVLIVGHTDSVGDEASNQRLSEARAVSVIRWLAGKEGIPVSIMVGRGMGERQPVAHNTRPDGSDDPAGRARNRRVELFVATTEKADVRNIAGLVTIDEGSVDVAGVARVDESGVHTGGVSVSPTGDVTVGGMTVSSAGSVTTGGGAAAGGGSEMTCVAGKTCNADCPQGSCRMSCSAGANCTYRCSGGDCTMSCASGATCSFACPGGDCSYTCAIASNCRTSCAGGGCSGG